MNTLTKQLDQAIAKLEYHRERLIYWRQRKQELETQIPTDNALQLVREFLEGENDDNHIDQT